MLPRHILFINPVGIIGGGERVLLTLMAALNSAEPDLRLSLIIGSPGPLVAAAQALGVTVEVLPLPERLLKLGDSGLKQPQGKDQGGKGRAYLALAQQVLGGVGELFRYRQQLAQKIRALQPDLIHSNGIKTHLLTSITAPASIPVVWHLHDFYSTRPFIAKILRVFQTKAKAGIAISNAVAQDSQQVLPRLPVQVIYNAIDIQRFAPAPTSLASAPDLKIGLIATFARWKGQDLFLQAAAQVLQALAQQNSAQKLQFWIIGGAVYETPGSQFTEAELRDLAVQLGIEKQVSFKGFQSDVPALLHQLDIVVHASTQPEPFGMTIIEAMACAKPVIVAAAGGACELIADAEDALGFKIGDAAALATAMITLIHQPQLRAALASRARQTVVSRFAQPRLGQEVLVLYRDICRGSVSV
jgi:glycosyltransferase involved in cell wall biosynthesis